MHKHYSNYMVFGINCDNSGEFGGDSGVCGVLLCSIYCIFMHRMGGCAGNVICHLYSLNYIVRPVCLRNVFPNLLSSFSLWKEKEAKRSHRRGRPPLRLSPPLSYRNYICCRVIAHDGVSCDTVVAPYVWRDGGRGC